MGLCALLHSLTLLLLWPPLHPFDETQHFLWARDFARQPQWHGGMETTVPEELVWLAEWTGLARGLPRHTPDQARNFWDKLVQLGEQDGGRQVPDFYRRYATHPPFRLYHPPLYSALCAPVHLVLAHQSIVVRLAGQRLLSCLLGALGVFLSYRIGRQLWPERFSWALALAAMTAFHPSYAFYSAVANSEILETVLTLGLVWLLLRPPTPGRAAGLGLITALGLLTRVSFLPLALLPLAALRRRARVALLPCFLAGLWYLPLLTGEANALFSWFARDNFDPTYAEPLWTPWRYLAHFDWSRWGWAVVGYWAGPLTIDPERSPCGARDWVLVGLTALSATGIAWAALRRPSRSLLLVAAPTVLLVAFYQAIDYLMVRGQGDGAFFLRSQYLLPGIAGQLAWWLTGVGGRAKRLPWALTLLMFAASFCSSSGVLNRYYWPAPYLESAERASLLWWLPAATLGRLRLASLACDLLLLAGLWQACNGEEPEAERS